MKARPFIPPEVLNAPGAVDFYLPHWVWIALDRQHRGTGHSIQRILRSAIAREFAHMRNKARRLIMNDGDTYTLTRYGTPATWAVVTVPMWVLLEMKLQAERGGPSVADRIAHGLKLQILGARMMHQLSLFE